VGYRLRPGVAASVYLAFTLENGYAVTIPAGSRSQSIPGPGELPQFFETAEPCPPAPNGTPSSRANPAPRRSITAFCLRHCCPICTWRALPPV
jgi:hypothetical protein